jgi:gliding motility-associated-like protein
LDTVIINVDSTVTDYLPCAFTPNGDGLNDYFLPYNNTFEKVVEFSVFNRWGTLVYHSTGETKGWDGTYNGTPQDMGTYNYLIILAHPDGRNVQFAGTVTLLR